jgi:hypothetical protein
MSRALAAGVAYFALIFALGFAFGTLRVLVLAPRLGAVGGTLLELPIILTASWVACGWLLDWFDVAPALRDRLLVGGIAYTLLMVAELAVSILMFGRSIGGHVETYKSVSAQAGLAGQVVFAAIPLLRRRAAR